MTGPAVGDRVEVRLTGRVVEQHTGEHPSLEIELDEDLVVVTGEDSRVLAFEHPDRVVLLRDPAATR